MKILLTSLPKSGKSIMLANLIADVSSKYGLTSPEIREKGERIGFDLYDETGNTAPLSRVKTATVTLSDATTKMWNYKKQPVKLVYNYKRMLTTEVL